MSALEQRLYDEHSDLHAEATRHLTWLGIDGLCVLGSIDAGQLEGIEDRSVTQRMRERRAAYETAVAAGRAVYARIEALKAARDRVVFGPVGEDYVREMGA